MLCRILAGTFAVLATLMLAAPPPATAGNHDGASRSFTLPAPVHLDRAARHGVWVTTYTAHRAREAAPPGAIPLLDVRGEPIGVWLSRRDWCRGAMEGTILVTSARDVVRTFNFINRARHGTTDCSDVFPQLSHRMLRILSRARFAEAPADAPFGLGARPGYRLVPYRSIAVDLRPGRPFALETVLFLPNLKGVRLTLPDGRSVVHDGYVMAVDRGTLIKGQHIDLFKGPSRSDAPPPSLASTRKRPINAFVIRDDAIIAALLTEHRRE